jgi:dephospho-CoA kinase
VVILGLTGSIGMGKSTAAGVFRRLGVPLHDADAAVHELLGRDGAAVAPIAAAFPDVVVDGAVDRQRLGARVFGDPAALARLEAIVHPLVRARALAFLKTQARGRQTLVVLDIPLLFETGAEALCDAVVLVTAPRRVQEARVLSRPGMTSDKFAAIRAQQMPDTEKRRRADFIVPTGLGRRESLRRLTAIVRLMKYTHGRHWPPRVPPLGAPRREGHSHA